MRVEDILSSDYIADRICNTNLHLGNTVSQICKEKLIKKKKKDIRKQLRKLRKLTYPNDRQMRIELSKVKIINKLHVY